MKVNKYQKQMRLEFKDVMISIYSSLSAGATVEQSLRRVWEDMERSLKPESRMLLELELVCRKMERNIPTAQCLEEMAERCRDAEIENFTQILILGKKQGGKLAMLVRDSVEKIQQRIETTYEIEGLIGAKRNEFLFMCMIPAGIIVYMRLFSPEFMSVLYGNCLLYTSRPKLMLSDMEETDLTRWIRTLAQIRSSRKELVLSLIHI